MIIKLICILLPWKLRRLILQKYFKYDIHPTARIGLSWIYPQYLYMGENSRIDHFNVAIHLNTIKMNKLSTISRNNWITGFPVGGAMHFLHQPDRKSELIIGEHSAITKNHHIDCTNSIIIGKFCTVAGYNTQMLTHSINIYENIQDSAPIFIGDYTMVGTNSTILGGAVLPSYSVLAAKSLLNKPFVDEWTIYGGVPAKAVREIPKEAKYFYRTDGFVY